jgi:glutathione synthase/RimK-type ligase-like ATP-grasp enzyme
MRLVLDEVEVLAKEITNVWYRRPRGIAIRGAGTDAERLHTAREWGAALDGFLAEIPQDRWMNHPAANARANSKLFQLQVARQYRLRIPNTLVTTNLDEARAFWAGESGMVITKPLSSGHVETRDGAVEASILTSAVDEEHLRDASLMAGCPTLLQQRVSKGADVRVTIVDGQVCALSATVGTASVAPLDIRENGMSGLVYDMVQLPPDVEGGLLAMCLKLQLRFAAIDLIRSQDGDWYFLEVNPNGQWAWLDLVGAADIARFFVKSFGVWP